jgi:hypothetical protein
VNSVRRYSCKHLPGALVVFLMGCAGYPEVPRPTILRAHHLGIIIQHENSQAGLAAATNLAVEHCLKLGKPATVSGHSLERDRTKPNPDRETVWGCNGPLVLPRRPVAS